MNEQMNTCNGNKLLARMGCFKGKEQLQFTDRSQLRVLVVHQGNDPHRQMNVFTKIRAVPGGMLQDIKNELGNILTKVNGKDDTLYHDSQRCFYHLVIVRLFPLW